VTRGNWRDKGGGSCCQKRVAKKLGVLTNGWGSRGVVSTAKKQQARSSSFLQTRVNQMKRMQVAQMKAMKKRRIAKW